MASASEQGVDVGTDGHEPNCDSVLNCKHWLTSSSMTAAS